MLTVTDTGMGFSEGATPLRPVSTCQSARAARDALCSAATVVKDGNARERARQRCVAIPWRPLTRMNKSTRPTAIVTDDEPRLAEF